jgi:hypothetical protein
LARFGRPDAVEQVLPPAVADRRAVFLVPKEPALEQRLGDACAVDRHERLVAARAPLVQSAGDQFLGRAALPLDEHATVATSHGIDQRKDLTHSLGSPAQHIRLAGDTGQNSVSMCRRFARLPAAGLQRS